MKVLFSFLLCLLLFLSSYSQNNGQYFENNVLRVEYVSFDNNVHTFKVSNKLNCQVLVKVSKEGVFSDHSFAANEYRTFTIEGPQLPQKSLKAKRENGGECITDPDNGWVEIGSLIVLPVQFSSIVAKKVSAELVELTFEAEQDIDIQYYNIRVSKDGKTFRKVVVVFPNKVQGRKRYTALIKL